jgi:type II secretory pathway component PulF
MWLPVLWFGTLLALALVMLALPATRDWLRWRLPGFQESSLAQFAATMRLMLGGGGDLGQAIGLMQRIEGPSRLGAELARWKGRLAEGHGHFAQFAHGSPLLPGMFLWLVGQDGDDLARGFGRAAQVYFDRARYRVEMMLYAALPVMVLILGFVIVAQAVGMMRLVTVTLGCLGGADGES